MLLQVVDFVVLCMFTYCNNFTGKMQCRAFMLNRALLQLAVFLFFKIRKVVSFINNLVVYIVYLSSLIYKGIRRNKKNTFLGGVMNNAIVICMYILRIYYIGVYKVHYFISLLSANIMNCKLYCFFVLLKQTHLIGITLQNRINKTTLLFACNSGIVRCNF